MNDKKPAQIRFHLKRPHSTIRKLSDNINMDNTIAGSFNVHTFLEGNLIKPLLFRQKYMDINYTNIYCKPVR